MKPISEQKKFAICVAGVLLAMGACRKSVDVEKFADVYVPNDPGFAKLWGMRKIGALTTSDSRRDCTAIKVAIIDTGVDYTHEDLNANVLNAGQNTITGATASNYIDDHYHGTHVAGTIGAVGDNGVGVAGVCWHASILPVKALDSSGSGTLADVASAITYAQGQSANVINMSLGGSTTSTALETAISSAQTSGILIVAAAGNSATDNDSTSTYPASYASIYNNMIAVAAIGSDEGLASFSNYGPGSVGIAAPGVGIYSTLPSFTTSSLSSDGYPTYYGTLDGTSMAAPHVTGAAAYIWSKHTSWTYSQVRTQIFNLAQGKQSLAAAIAGGRKLYIGENP